MSFMFKSIICVYERNVFLGSNLLVSKLMINCSSVSFLCLVSLKFPFKMQTFKSLML